MRLRVWCLPAAFLVLAWPAWADAQEPSPGSADSSGTPQAANDASTGRTVVDEHPPRYTLQGIEIRGNTRTQNRVILRYVPFQPGDALDVSDPEVQLTRFRLLGTGFFSSVQLSLRKGDRRGDVILVINVVERNTIIVNDLWLGMTGSRTEGRVVGPGRLYAYGGADVAEKIDFGGSGIMLGGAVAIGDHQLGIRTRFLDPAFLGSGWMASASILYNDARDFFGSHGVQVAGALSDGCDCAVLDYSRFGATAAAGHDLSVATQLWLEARVERIRVNQPPLAASALRGLDREPITFNLIPGESVLSTLRASLLHDTRDQPILPTRGYYLSILADFGIAPFGSDYQYTKLQFRASKWWTLPWRHIARLELAYGGLTGEAPLFERFYVGDYTDLMPDRVLDLSFDRRTAPNLLHTDIVEVRYGDYAAKLQGEYRVPVYRGHRAVYGIDLFGAVGLYGVATYRDLTDPPRGYGGLRTLPIDLTFNFGLRIDTAAGGVSLAFSNLLGLLPVRGQGGLWPREGGIQQ